MSWGQEEGGWPQAAAARSMADSVDLWTNIVCDLFALSYIQQVGLLLRFYSGSVENEVFNVTWQTVRLDDFAIRLSRISEGELLMVERC
jgi:hypothetical protein